MPSDDMSFWSLLVVHDFLWILWHCRGGTFVRSLPTLPCLCCCNANYGAAAPPWSSTPSFTSPSCEAGANGWPMSNVELQMMGLLEFLEFQCSQSITLLYHKKLHGLAHLGIEYSPHATFYSPLFMIQLYWSKFGLPFESVHYDPGELTHLTYKGNNKLCNLSIESKLDHHLQPFRMNKLTLV